jgi:hypothetical protein
MTMHETGHDPMIIKVLGLVSVLGTIGLIFMLVVEAYLPDSDLSSETLVAVTSAAMGALASKLNTGSGQTQDSHRMEVLGSAVESTLIAQMVKTIARDDSDVRHE